MPPKLYFTDSTGPCTKEASARESTLTLDSRALESKKKAITMRTGYDLSAVNVLRMRARASIARNTQYTFFRICRMIRFDSVTGAVGTISLT